MRSVLLTAYTVRVKKAHARKEYEQVDSFSDDEFDLLEVLHGFLESRRNAAYNREDAQQVLQVSVLHPPKNRQIEGLLESGGYGSASHIRNLAKWDKIAYAKSVSDVDLHPFYFLFDLPGGRDMGHLVIQRTGTEGAQTILSQDLCAAFADKYADYRLIMRQVIPERLIRELEAKEVSQIDFIRHSIPSDITTTFGRESTKQTPGSMRLLVKFDKSFFGWEEAKRFVDEHRGTDSVLELEEGDTRFPWDNVKIKVKTHGKERTMDLGDPNKMRASVDVTEEIKWDKFGHPTFASISEAARQLLSDLNTPTAPRKKP